jgi:hypothetical protein
MRLNFLSGWSHLLGSVIIRACNVSRRILVTATSYRQTWTIGFLLATWHIECLFISSKGPRIVCCLLVMRVAFSALLERPQRGDSLVKLVHVLMMIALLDMIFKHVSKPTNPLHMIQHMSHNS